MEAVDRFLEEAAAGGLLRKLVPVTGRKGGKIFFGSREAFDLSSNDYLGLSGHPRLVKASRDALTRRG